MYSCLQDDDDDCLFAYSCTETDYIEYPVLTIVTFLCPCGLLDFAFVSLLRGGLCAVCMWWYSRLWWCFARRAAWFVFVLFCSISHDCFLLPIGSW